ncbi:helix-turn-helix domain-containing protein [Coprococcus comes]|nr:MULTISPECIES: helix-turn-helix domain-containing protein [Coprococcus]
MERCHGNRNLAAKELGISTTTLWRRMKERLSCFLTKICK